MLASKATRIEEQDPSADDGQQANEAGEAVGQNVRILRPGEEITGLRALWQAVLLARMDDVGFLKIVLGDQVVEQDFVSEDVPRQFGKVVAVRADLSTDLGRRVVAAFGLEGDPVKVPVAFCAEGQSDLDLVPCEEGLLDTVVLDGDRRIDHIAGAAAGIPVTVGIDHGVWAADDFLLVDSILEPSAVVLGVHEVECDFTAVDFHKFDVVGSPDLGAARRVVACSIQLVRAWPACGKRHTDKERRNEQDRDHDP